MTHGLLDWAAIVGFCFGSAGAWTVTSALQDPSRFTRTCSGRTTLRTPLGWPAVSGTSGVNRRVAATPDAVLTRNVTSTALAPCRSPQRNAASVFFTGCIDSTDTPHPAK